MRALLVALCLHLAVVGSLGQADNKAPDPAGQKAASEFKQCGARRAASRARRGRRHARAARAGSPRSGTADEPLVGAPSGYLERAWRASTPPALRGPRRVARRRLAVWPPRWAWPRSRPTHLKACARPKAPGVLSLTPPPPTLARRARPSGGSTNCGSGARCKDGQWPDVQCAEGFVCDRQNAFYWQVGHGLGASRPAGPARALGGARSPTPSAGLGCTLARRPVGCCGGPNSGRGAGSAV
jgi:hypothetical protein